MENARKKKNNKELGSLVEEVKINYELLLDEWKGLQNELHIEAGLSTSFVPSKRLTGEAVHVKKNDLTRLATEIGQLKQTLPKILNKNVVNAHSQLYSLEEENKKLRENCSILAEQSDQWKSRYEAAIADTQMEKKECLKLRCEIQTQSQQLTQQSDYCASLGSACCTLLWRVSRREESIQSILAGTKTEEFLSLVSSTLQSYLTAYKDEWPLEETVETQFILALCGIITNIAASAYGRDFLITNLYGKQVLDTYIKLLSEIPTGKSARLKNLMTMSLYNISINQKGIKYLSAKQGLLSLAAWLLQGESDSELRLNCLRVIQSLVFDETNFNAVHEVHEVLPDAMLELLSKDQNQNVREFALELITDLQQLARQPRHET